MANRRLYRSMQGKIVDMELLSQKNELAPAIGNIRVNARGDELGPGGKIVRKREEIMAEYYENNPSAVRDEQYIRPASAQPKTLPTESKLSETKKTAIKKEVKDDHKEDQTDS
jgi:hypothetical protein